jgi:hypothetical protein
VQISNSKRAQKSLLHDAHVEPEARVDDLSEDGCFASGMMVLLLEHVHLQKEGGARRD